MRVCIKCKKELTVEHFHKNRLNADGIEHTCKVCRKIESREKYIIDPFKSLARCKRSESKKKNIAYDLDANYLKSIWTGMCPIFNIPIEIGREGMGSHKSGHLDRLIPELGYTKGNVNYISGRANRIKYDATVNELLRVATWLEAQLNVQRLSSNGVGSK